MRKLVLLLLCLLGGNLAVPTNAQTARLQARETEWKNYPLPQTNFTRQVIAGDKIIFRVPADWKQESVELLSFSGPHSSMIRVLVHTVPEGSSLGGYLGAVLQGIRNLPGATEATFTRRTQFQDLEAREVLIEAPEPGGEMTRSTSWLTIVGPLAVTFNLQVPLAHAADVEPFFKATVQSVIFVPDNYSEFAALRAGVDKTPAPIHEVEAIVASLNELNSDRESAINRLIPIFSATPDAVVDLMLDRRATVRSAAVEALVRSRNAGLKSFLWYALGDADPQVGETAARIVAQEPDVVTTLLSRSTPKGTIEIAARLWPFLTADNRAKIFERFFNSTNKADGPSFRIGALTLLNMVPVAELGLPFARVLSANDDQLTFLALQIAVNRSEALPVDSLLKLTASPNQTIRELAIESLGQSAAVADIPRVEALKDLDEERLLAIKKIRFRHELTLAKGAEESQAIIRKAMSDSALANFAWRFDCEATLKGCSSAAPKRLEPEFKVKSFAENLLPKQLRHYTAIPKPGQAVERFYETLNGLQLDSPRAQSNLILVMGSLREKLSQELGAPAEAPALIEYTGIKPDTPIVMASWTASGARDSTLPAQRRAIVLQVKDRKRFERVVHSLQQKNGGVLPMTDYVAVATRATAALPAVLPLSAREILTDGPTKPKPTPVLKYSFIGQSEWNGITIKTLEHRAVGTKASFENAYTCLAFIGDAAILTDDLATIRDLVTNAGAGDEQLLSSNEEFRRSIATDGDVVYFSDLNAVFPDQDETRKAGKANESGSLKFSNSTWENSHRLEFNESDWSKPLVPFNPKELTAPRELLPASTIVYYLMKLDVADAFETWPKTKSIPDEITALSEIWAMDLKREVLPELGPECGVALLELSALSLSGGAETWTAFCKLKSNKLAEALTNGKLFRGVGPTSDVAEVKIDGDSYFVASKGGFLAVSNQRKALASLADKTNLAATRDYSRAAERVPSGVVAFGGYNLEASIAAASATVGDGFKAQQAALVFSVASAFHSQSFFATATPGGIEGRSSVAMDREGRYSVADLSYLPKGVNITLAAVEARGVPITDQNRLSKLLLKIQAKAAGPIDDIREDIKTAHQAVEQKSANELLVTIAARNSNPDKKIQLPVGDPNLAPFLKASGDIAADDPQVVARAKEIAGEDRDAWSVARKLANWTHENLEWKHVASAGAAQTLASREADCSEFSELFVAMARSLGLPARIVSGLAHSGGTFGGHAWVEVWVGEWIELDPTWGTDFVDATHIRNTSSALVTAAALNLIEVEILEAHRTIADFQKSPKALAEHLANALPEGDRSEIEAALDLEMLTDEYMGAGAWNGLSENERDQMASAYRRTLSEILQGYRKSYPAPNDIHLLHVEVKGNRAEAWCLDSEDDTFFKLRLAQRNGAWHLVEMIQADTGLHIAAEMFAPAVKSVAAARAGSKTTVSGLSDTVRSLMLFETDPEKAREVIERAVQAKPSDQNLRYIKALTLLLLEKEDETIKLLTDLSNEQPAHAQAIFKLAEYLIETEAEKAIELYQRYSALEPFDPRAYRNLAALYEDSGQIALAEAANRKQITTDPLDLNAYINLSRLLVLNKRIGEVGAVLVAADPYAGPDEDLMARLLDELYSDVDLADAQKLADSHPQRMKTSYANLSLAAIYMRDNKYRAALPFINRALQIDPKGAAPQVSLSAAYLRLFRFADALKAANNAISLEEDNAGAHYQRARVLSRLGRSKDALSAFEKALELDPDAIDWVENDPQMKSFKSLPAFKKLLEQKTSPEPK